MAAMALAWAGCSDGTPTAPQALTIKAGNGQAVLSWSPDYDVSIQSYKISWGLDQKSTVQTVTVPASPTKYTAKGLTNGTKYYFSMTSLSTAGETSARSAYVSVTPDGSIVNAPELVTTVPQDQSKEVSITTPFQLDFSVAMATNSVNVTSDPALTFGGANWTSGNTTVSFATSTALTPGTTYTLTVTGNSAAGVAMDPTTFSFSTTTPPSILAAFYYSDLSVTPRPLVGLPNATAVPSPAALFIEFSEPMATGYYNTNLFPITISPSVYFLEEWFSSAAGAQTILKLTRRDADPNTSTTINPIPWTLGQKYSLSIGGTGVSQDNIPLGQTQTFPFTITTTADTTPPTLATSQGTSPVDGGSAGLTDPIQVQFDEAMNEYSVAAAVTVTSPTGFNLDFPVKDPTSTLFTFSVPGGSWPAGTVTFQISTDATDIAGNHLAAPVTVTFTAADES